MSHANLPDNYPSNPLADAIADDLDCGIAKSIMLSVPIGGSSGVARIQWDEWIEFRSPEHEHGIKGCAVSGGGRRTDIARLIHFPVSSPAAIEQWCTDMAWVMGGGYLHRWTRPPRPGDRDIPGSGLRHFFGHSIYKIMGEEDTIGQGADDAILTQAECHGYRSWEFNSAWRKAEGASAMYLPKWRQHDPTLNLQGGRDTLFPGWRDDKWTTLAKTFELADPNQPDLMLCIQYDLTKLRVNKRLR
jgi:hypothetical protein